MIGRKRTVPRGRSRAHIVLIGAIAAVLLATLASTALSANSSPQQAGATALASASDGTLTIGIMGSSTESIDPAASTTAYAKDLRDHLLYGALTTRDSKGKVIWDLATSMTPNKTLTQWTVKLRPNVKTHNGGVFTADDVIFSVRRILDPKQHAAGAHFISAIVNPRKVVKINDTTVRFTLRKAFGPFKDVWSNGYLYMIPRDWTVEKPNGTGPFKYVSFTPGQESTFVRFDGYWGGPFKFKTLRIIDFNEMQAIVNALRGGQIDVAAQVPLIEARALDSGNLKTIVSDVPATVLVGIRTDIKPFDDPRVIKAIRLTINRPQVVSAAFAGYGSVANDMLVRNNGACPLPNVPQRKQDIPQAKKLLQQAGVKNLTLSIANPADTPGMVEMLQVYQANAKLAGITIKLNTMSFPKYGAGWLKWPAGVDVPNNPYLFNVTNSLMTGANANIGHWDDAQFMKIANQALATADPKKRCKLEQQLQRIEWDRSPYLLSAWSNQITGYNADKVSGLGTGFYHLSVFYLTNVSVKG